MREYSFFYLLNESNLDNVNMGYPMFVTASTPACARNQYGRYVQEQKNKKFDFTPLDESRIYVSVCTAKAMVV